MQALIDGFLEKESSLPQTASLPASAPSDWTRLAITGQLFHLLDGKWFDICTVDALDQALGSLREQCGLPQHHAHSCADHAGLRVLHVVHYDDMQPPVAAGLPDAVLRVLGLDGSTLVCLLGQDNARTIIERYGRGVQPPAPALQPPSPTPPAPVECLVAPCVVPRATLWRRLFSRQRPPHSA
jgi:hypothetical protein